MSATSIVRQRETFKMAKVRRRKALCVLIMLLEDEEEDNRKKCRTTWIKPWVARREENGCFQQVRFVLFSILYI